uniref:Uncharacterized protein n=2 Tax=Noccaea caerulescens TaxID=107243 RepID=A0A1J3IU96_NOCCA
MSENSIEYLGLCVRYEPPIIGIHYKQRPSDTKKKVYTIILQKLVLHPDPEEAARQLYREHPHILKEDKIPVHKIASLIAKIQEELQLNGDYYDEDYEESGEHEQYVPPQKEPIKEPVK